MNLLRAASTVSLWTLASRITGLVREFLIASTFGVSAFTDAFNVAFRIPNLLRRLFGEGAFSQAFVPLLASAHATQTAPEQQRFLNAVATVLFWALVLVAVIGIVGAPVLVLLLASGLKTGEGFDDAVLMTRIMFPYILCMSLVAFAAGILNTWKHFTVPAATPVLLNLSMIAAALFLARYFNPPIYALAVGVMAGGVLQLAVQLPALRRHAQLPRVGLDVRAAWRDPGVQNVVKLMLPATLGVGVAQLSMIINTQIASHLQAGSITWLNLADRLMEFPTAMIGVALGVVLIPSLTKAHTLGDTARYNELLDWGLRLVLLLAMPAGVALLMFAVPLSAALYHYGAFKASDVTQTALALSCYGVGLVGLIGVKVLAPGFFAQKDIATPVKIALIVLATTQSLNLLFVPYLQHAGLALALACGSLLNAGLLLFGLKRRGSYVPLPGWPAFAARVLLASALMGAALWAATHYVDWVALRAQWVLRLLALGGVIAASAALYFGTLRVLGLRPQSFIKRV